MVVVSVAAENAISSSGSRYLIAGNWDGVPGETLPFMRSPSHVYLPKHTNQCPRQDIEANGFFGITPYACLYKK